MSVILRIHGTRNVWGIWERGMWNVWYIGEVTRSLGAHRMCFVITGNLTGL